jgi:hypothetical protein
MAAPLAFDSLRIVHPHVAAACASMQFAQRSFTARHAKYVTLILRRARVRKHAAEQINARPHADISSHAKAAAASHEMSNLTVLRRSMTRIKARI